MQCLKREVGIAFILLRCEYAGGLAAYLFVDGGLAATWQEYHAASKDRYWGPLIPYEGRFLCFVMPILLQTNGHARW
jgi:hypothetical protein